MVGPQPFVRHSLDDRRAVLRVQSGQRLDQSRNGVALSAKGRLDEAIASYQKALHLKADNAGARYNVALALAKKGLTEEADKEFAEAHRIYPSFKAPGHSETE